MRHIPHGIQIQSTLSTHCSSAPEEGTTGNLRVNVWGVTNGIVFKALYSHVADCSLSHILSYMKITLGTCACVSQIPKEEYGRGNCSLAVHLGGDSHFLSVSFSIKDMHPIAKKKKEECLEGVV